MAVVGPQTRTAFAEPGIEIDLEALRNIYAGLRGFIDESGGTLCAESDEALSDHLSAAVEGVEGVEIRLELPDRYATPFAQALIATDVAWRIACLVSEGEGDRLPTAGKSINLNEVVPIEECSLEIVLTEDGSIVAKVKDFKKRVTYTSAMTAIAVILPATGINLVNMLPSDHDQGQGAPIEFVISTEAPQAVKDDIAAHLPTAPANSQVVAEVKLTDGRSVRITVPDDGLR